MQGQVKMLQFTIKPLEVRTGESEALVGTPCLVEQRHARGVHLCVAHLLERQEIHARRAHARELIFDQEGLCTQLV